MTDYRHLDVRTTESGVRTITLNRPERLNAVNPSLALELPAALREAHADDEVRVIVLTGAGRAFCAGLDLSEPAGLGAGSRADRLDDLAWVGRWVLAVAECEKPVIAALNGVAAGAGFGLALAADIRVIATGASLMAGYIRRGLSPDAGVSWWLPRLIGAGRATEIILTGRDVTADEAERIGLVSRQLPADDFGSHVATYAESFAAGPPIALALSKRLLRSALEQPLRDHLRDELTHIRTAFGTEDVQEALVAFREKRTPVFRGR
ncbi:MAG: enoyl-CoA hydratase-related protein [Gemmatimonadaceae bacterium]|jgi:2-(1,2-epoxy-1,2-dihydrophenyl)acetyl-CoA isomerase|nr:enoyl-CoA hydratase-related protein [Gemmatimonadaceae bacterium]